ncbi:MAG: M23 family metallopeptidase, partial [Oscillospiraceae bacterium]|nr:M23 family metallopeptidase [Oscillospiraceae bacterium]
DIAAPLGTKIKAAYNGTVSRTGEDSRSGKYIYLSHSNGLETLYCHCSSILAKKGAKIRQGETIALVGSTGWSTGPHLHFEIHKNGERIDPMPFLKEG